MRILIAEDDPNLRDGYSSLLGSAGHEVATAANGREALDHLRAGWLPDLILLDLLMPVMDGWAFRDVLLTVPEFSTVPVILVSGRDDLGREASAFGAAAHLRKPFAPADLLAIIDKVTR